MESDKFAIFPERMAMPNTSLVSIRQISFYILLIFLGIFLIGQLNAFIPAFLGALTFHVLLSKPMNWLTDRKKWSPGLAATALLLFTIIVVLVPISMAFNIVYNKVGYAIQHSGNVMAGLTSLINQAEQRFQITLISDQNIEKIGLLFASILPKVVGATVDSLLTMVMMLFILFFLLSNNKAIQNWCLHHVPLQQENTRRLGKELNTLVLSNALGIPATALFQGVIGAIGYYFLGVKDVGFWMVVTCIASMIPMVGAALAWVPVALIFFAEGDTTRGIIMLVYGAVVMGVLDNVFRMSIQKKVGDTHPLITTFGVILGVKLFGFIGLIFGPIVIALFILLVKIYIHEFVDSK